VDFLQAEKFVGTILNSLGAVQGGNYQLIDRLTALAIYQYARPGLAGPANLSGR
jgi:hypothetical protein